MENLLQVLYKNFKNFKVISNQWEPSTPSNQHANQVYLARWPEIVRCFDEDCPRHDVLEISRLLCGNYFKNSKGLMDENSCGGVFIQYSKK